MAERYGSFRELAGGRQSDVTPADIADWIKAAQVRLIPGMESYYDIVEGRGVDRALEDLGAWIPGYSAYRNFVTGRPQDWEQNAVDAVAAAIPVAKPAARTARELARDAARDIARNSKEGFVVRPDYQFKKPSQEEATRKLADAWTRESKATGKIARPQKLPSVPVEYADPLANQITDEQFRFGGLPISKTYTDPATGKTVTENAAKLDAILPEHATEAAYVRHNKTAYDDRLRNVRHAMEQEPKLRKQFRNVGTDYGWETQLPTGDGKWADRNARTKVKSWNSLEQQMPGYKEAAAIPDPNGTNLEYMVNYRPYPDFVRPGLTDDPLGLVDVDDAVEHLADYKYDMSLLSGLIDNVRAGNTKLKPREAEEFLQLLEDSMKRYHNIISVGERESLRRAIDGL